MRDDVKIQLTFKSLFVASFADEVNAEMTYNMASVIIRVLSA